MGVDGKQFVFTPFLLICPHILIYCYHVRVVQSICKRCIIKMDHHCPVSVVKGGSTIFVSLFDSLSALEAKLSQQHHFLFPTINKHSG